MTHSPSPQIVIQQPSSSELLISHLINFLPCQNPLASQFLLYGCREPGKDTDSITEHGSCASVNTWAREAWRDQHIHTCKKYFFLQCYLSAGCKHVLNLNSNMGFYCLGCLDYVTEVHTFRFNSVVQKLLLKFKALFIHSPPFSDTQN